MIFRKKLLAPHYFLLYANTVKPALRVHLRDKEKVAL
jgi:hypothetical protein